MLEHVAIIRKIRSIELRTGLRMFQWDQVRSRSLSIDLALFELREFTQYGLESSKYDICASSSEIATATVGQPDYVVRLFVFAFCHLVTTCPYLFALYWVAYGSNTDLGTVEDVRM